MFGISLSEFFVIIVVAVLIVPSKKWPDVARFLARADYLENNGCNRKNKDTN